LSNRHSDVTMTVNCSLTISVDANGNLFNVNIPDWMNRPTINLIMAHISQMDAGITGVDVQFADGRIMISETRANRTRARSDNQKDGTPQTERKPADKKEEAPPPPKTGPVSTESPVESASPESLEDAIEHKIGDNICHGLSSSPAAELDVAHHANGRGQVQMLPSDADFINDGVCDDDIQQGGLGDCWFLAALASVADDRHDPASTVRRILRNKVIMGDVNKDAINRHGDKFQFNFYRMGEWHTVTVDGELPKKRRAQSSKTNEWWVPLTEKAYAKFNGSYDNIDYGVSSWGLAELTGGIPIIFDLQWDKINPIGVENFKSFVKQYLAKNTICCAGNKGSGGEGLELNGLVTGHAYSVLNIVDINTYKGPVTLVRLRNPWGKHEWKGDWSDDSDKWRMVSAAIKTKIGYAKVDDGGFFMSMADWIDQFETFTMCYMNLTNDNQHFGMDQRVIGTLVPGVNAVENNPNDVQLFNLQFALIVEYDQDVWIQPLQNQRSQKDGNIFSVTALFDTNPLPTGRVDMQYRHSFLEYLKPMMAVREGLTFVPYQQNGYCYRLKAGNYFLMQGFVVPTQREYMIRIIGNGVTVNMLK